MRLLSFILYHLYLTLSFMENQAPDARPSAEVQAVVMQLWNVVRETTQTANGIASERNALLKKFTALETTLHQEQQKTAKMQHYIEHLESEAKTNTEEFTKLQQQYRDNQEISRHRDETIQELRRTQIEKEELITRLNTQVQEQALIITERVSEIVAQEDELERLRDELGNSNDRAMQASERLAELEPLYIESQEEKALLSEETERLRWQLTAVTEQTAKERVELETEQERKLTDAHAENGRLLAAMEDVKRVLGESEQRIRVLEDERTTLQTTVQEQLQKVQQDAQTWQQIAEEQEQTFSVKEQAIREELERIQAAASDETSRIAQLQEELQSTQNLLVLEKAAHEQALQSLKTSQIQETEMLRASHRQALEAVRTELLTELHTTQESAQKLAAQATVERNNAERAINEAKEAHLSEINRLQEDLEAAQNRLHMEQERWNEERAKFSITDEAHGQVIAQVQDLQTQLQALRAEQQDRQNNFEIALEHAKREAQIRMEMELDATRQVMSMKDREIEQLRASVESLQATNSRTVHDSDEKEARIKEMEALILDLEAQRTALENDLESASQHASMSDKEREVLAQKVRQMLSRVEAALEEEVR